MRTAWLQFGIPMLVATVVSLCHAQEPSPIVLGTQQQTPQDRGSAGASIGVGIGLGVAGFLAGGLIGYAIASDCTSSEFCQLEGAFYGAAAGGTFGMALGVHLGNRRRGSLALDFLTGAVIWGAGIGIAAASNDETVITVAFVTVPIVQLVSTVAVERAVGRSRSRRRDIAVAVIPTVTGGPGLAVSVAF